MSNYSKAVEYLIAKFPNVREAKTDKITFMDMTVGTKLQKLHEADPPYKPDEEQTRAYFRLVISAESDAEAYDLVAQTSQFLVLSGREIPMPFRGFIARVLAGKLQRPTPPHREAEKDFAYKLYVYQMVVSAHTQFGLDITRNDVSQPVSACDAVLDALSELGVHTSYSSVKNLIVHPSQKALREKIESYFRLHHGKDRVTLENLPK